MRAESAGWPNSAQGAGAAHQASWAGWWRRAKQAGLGKLAWRSTRPRRQIEVRQGERGRDAVNARAMQGNLALIVVVQHTEAGETGDESSGRSIRARSEATMAK